MKLDYSGLLPVHELMPGFRGRFLHSEAMTLVFWEIDAGAVLPEHNHPHEQVSYLLSGNFELSIDGETRLLAPGAVAVIPGHARHSGKALTDCRILDIFHPRREDYNFG